MLFNISLISMSYRISRKVLDSERNENKEYYGKCKLNFLVYDSSLIATRILSRFNRYMGVNRTIE